MDRPQHRRLILIGLVLVAAGALLLFGRQWMSMTEPTSIKAESPTRQLIEPTVDRAEPPPVAAAATPDNAPTTTAAGPNGTFRGRVVDAVTRQPVQEFEVRLIDARRPEARFVRQPHATQTFRTTDGRFVWQQAPVGTWLVTVVAPRYQRFHVDNLSVAAGKTTRDIVMPLRRGQTLQGRVFDQSSGVGLGDAHISLRDPGILPMQIGNPEATGRSKGDGTFVLDGVPDGETIVRVSAKDHALREVHVIVKEDTPPLEIGLVTGGKVAGMVVAPDGTPASGQVMLLGSGMNYGGTLDETGSFSFANRPAGRYKLTAHTDAGSGSLDFELAENEFREGIVLKVGEGRTVRGVIRGLRPEQFEQTYISIHSESKRANFGAKADAQGAYAVKGVPPGRAHLTADAAMSRHFSKPIDVPADKDVVLDIVFAPGVRLSGLVTQGAKPVADRIVWVQSPDGKGETSYRGKTAQDGRYEVEGVAPGEHRITVHEGMSRVVTIASDTVVNFDLPLVQIGGRIVEDGGTVPIVGAGVHVIGTEPQTAVVRNYKESDDFGQFRLIGIEPGEVLLTVYKPGYEMQREKISYSSPLTNKTITLRRSAGVEVRVQSAEDGAPTRQLFVREQLPGSDSGIGMYVPVDREGVGYLPSALAGSTLSIQSSGSRPIVIERWNGQSLDLKFVSR